MTSPEGSESEPQGLTADESLTLGVEAYVYGYPLLVMDALRRVTTNVEEPQGTLAPAGQFGHHRVFPGASEGSSLAGASLDTLYSLAWLDVAQDAYLLRLPRVEGRFYMMPILDGWTEVIGNPGTRTTGEGPLTYLITGPGWSGTVPAGAEHIASGTDMVLLIGRTYCSGTQSDYDAVHAIQDQYTLTLLSEAGHHTTGGFDPDVDMSTPPRDQIDKLPVAAFFERLALLLKTNPPTADDARPMEALARLGLLDDPNGSKLPAAARGALSGVPEAAHKQILGHYVRQNQANGWMVSTGSGHYGTDYLQRALVAYIGVGGNLPDDAFYPIARVDGDGNPLNGANRYVMHFDAADLPPIHDRGFWSLTMYDEDYFLVSDPIDRRKVGSRHDFTINADGSIDLHIQEDSPGSDKEANWLPCPDGGFILMMRLYWPLDEALDGTWVPPVVRRSD